MLSKTRYHKRTTRPTSMAAITKFPFMVLCRTLFDVSYAVCMNSIFIMWICWMTAHAYKCITSSMIHSVRQMVFLNSESMVSIQRPKHGYFVAIGVVVIKYCITLGKMDTDRIVTGLSKWTCCSPRLRAPQSPPAGQ